MKYHPTYELEINGEVVKKSYNYASLMEWASANTDQPFFVFIRRKSKMSRANGISDISEVMELRKQGWTVEKIAKYLGCSTRGLQIRMRREYGTTVMDTRRIEPERKERIVLLHSKGQSIKQLAKHFGLGYATIWGIINRATRLEAA